MTKVRCKYCVKCEDGKCKSKKNAKINLTKKRYCTKYSPDTGAINEALEKVKNNKVPLYRHTFRYYEKEWAEAERRQKRKISDVEYDINSLVGPELVQVR